ncbi:MAG: universal stress protein [Deltaproteobacteria bacterium]|nr:universal stress protein [Deltaproteobacteria bacterium]
MKTLRAIVAGTDFSPVAETALRSAAHLARRYNAALHLLAVVVPPAVYRRALAAVVPAPATAQLVAAATERLQQLCGAPFLAGCKVVANVRVGVPFAELIAAGREYEASLIVVGARPHRGVEHLMLGHTTERVMRKAPVPVLIARSELNPEPTCVLAPIDFSDAARCAAEEAIALARRWIAKLIFLHVIEPIVQTYLWPLDSGAVEIFPAEPADLKGEWEDFLGDLDLHDLRWERRTLKGDAAALIEQTAREEAADLIVLGTHGNTGLAHALLGSLVERVVRTTARPVLTIRPEAFQFTLP